MGCHLLGEPVPVGVLRQSQKLPSSLLLRTLANFLSTEFHILSPFVFKPMVHNWGKHSAHLLLPRGYLATSGGTFDFHNWQDATGISWVEAKDAAEHLVMHKTVPTTKNYLDQCANQEEVGKL